MACGLLLQPAGGATAAADLWARLHVLPAHRRSLPDKVQLNRVCCIKQLRRKLTLSAAKSHRPRRLVGCSSSGSSAEVAAVSRPADVSTTQSNLTIRRIAWIRSQVRLLLFLDTGVAPMWMMVAVVLRPCSKESYDA